MKTPEDGYVTELTDYSGPLERVSAYHFYMQVYSKRRQYWRRRLSDWTRRSVSDAVATLSPDVVSAGARETIVISITIGATELETGGRIAVFFPFCFGGFADRASPICYRESGGFDGYGSLIVAKASNPAVELQTIVHSAGPVFTCPEIVVRKGALQKGDTIDLLIGDPSSKPQMISEKAKTFTFRIGIDHAGDTRFLPVRPDPRLKVVGGRPDHFRCYAPATPDVGETFTLRVVPCDRLNHNIAESYAGRVEVVGIESDGTETTRVDDLELTAESADHATIEGPSVTHPKVTRLQVIDKRQSLIGCGNPICPGAAPPGLRLYYGEIPDAIHGKGLRHRMGRRARRLLPPWALATTKATGSAVDQDTLVVCSNTRPPVPEGRDRAVVVGGVRTAPMAIRRARVDRR